MGKIINAVFKLRRGLAKDWTQANPILNAGEPAVEIDTLKMKIGNGLTPWNDLPYTAGDNGGVGETIIVKGGIQTVATLPQEGDPAVLYRLEDAQKLYAWNTKENKFDELGSNIEIPDFVDTNTDNIIIVNELPQIGEEKYLYKLSTNQKFYYWDTNKSAFVDFIPTVEIPDYVDTNTDNIQLVDTLPETGENNLLYKLLETQEFYHWDSKEEIFKKIMADVELPEIPEQKNNIIVVNELAELPEEGQVDVLYKVVKEQTLYNYNTITQHYEPLGQASNITTQDGYVIVLDYFNDRIFAVIEKDPVILKFRYTSVDRDGFNDGPGIGTLYVNQVRKGTFAIPQKTQELDITKFLSLGPNTVELHIENSEGPEKAKSLSYEIEVVNLYLTTSVKEMDTYFTDTSIPFTITGPGKKTIYYYLDDNETPYAEETLEFKEQLFHSFKVPMQPAGAHILKIVAYRNVNNINLPSNTLTIGMMHVTNEMVDTHILSTYPAQGTTAQQGNVITIPYMVYNPFFETADITLSIYEENDINKENPYLTKALVVDQTVQNWVIQDYPSGKVTFEIQAHSESGVDAIKTFTIDVEPTVFDLEVLTNGLAFEFTAKNRSNAEKDPGHWSYNGYEAQFERFAWSGADGWVESDSGETVLRFLPKNKMTIPYQPFATDKRNTGFTIELELETRDVADYDAVVVSCKDENGIGFEIKSQSVIFKSELTQLNMMFKEDERVRITIVIQPTTLNRFIYMFINGIMCGITQYDVNDNFMQNTKMPIVIGSDKSGIDLYKLRFYERDFTYTEQLNNYICDRSTSAERFKLKERNNIYDISGNLTIGSLPPEIPYLVMQCEELPQAKGDKKENKSVYFVDPLHPERNFTATGVTFDVQGTSSAGYPIKNFKVKFGNGIVRQNGESAKGYDIYEGGLLAKTLCLKADFASSEQANNIMLVDYYDELVRDYFKTPPQLENSAIRTGVRGRPIVVFWEDTTTGKISFNGQYNMNDDKSNENVFGFDRTKYPQLECWEFKNNTSKRTLFQKSDYEEIILDENGKEMLGWLADFEARFPDTKPAYTDYTNYKRLTDWVVSTDQYQATNIEFETPIVYNGEEYTSDTAEYRLAKFKAEFNDYFILPSVTFYYLFTETFLMIDNRAKNMFLTTFDGKHWFPIPYDFDTAIGINNEGKLVFDYDLEDTDKVGNDDVYNGQQSTLWINFRQAFSDEITAMYRDLRKNGKFSYEAINTKMNNHQESCWPEAIWNTDAEIKYITPFFSSKVNYFEMCQGNKKAQREWWLFNAFKYRDSKYYAGDAPKIFAFLRIYSKDDLSITPYQHLWPRVEFTRTYPSTAKAKRNQTVILENRLDEANDTEVWIDSIDRISSLGDMSKLYTDTVDFSQAVKLQEVILGSSVENYQNTHLSEVSLGSNRLLTYLNVENCINLSKSIDLAHCFNLEIVKAKGSILPSITFPIGGHLKELYLPKTFNNLTLRNQHMIETFDLEKVAQENSQEIYENLTSLWIDDTPGLPIEDILLNSPKLNRVRLVNTTWRVSSEENLRTIFEKLKQCSGLDASGKNTDNAIVTGFVEIDSLSDEFLEELNETFKELIVVVAGKPRFFIRYLNADNSLLYKYAISTGDNAIDPIEKGILETPVLEGITDTRYTFAKWSYLPENIQGPQNIVAMYDTEYAVHFLDGDNNIVNSQWVKEGDSAVDPLDYFNMDIPTKTSTAQFNFVFDKWITDYSVITAPLYVESTYSEFLRDYPVYFYNDNMLLQETIEPYGSYPVYRGNEEEIQKYLGGVPSDYYEFAHWSPSLSEPITGETKYYAQFAFNGYISDDWNTIAENVKNGNVDNYGYGGKKLTELAYSYEGKAYTDIVEFEIIDKNHDILQEVSSSYNNGLSTAGLTFRGLISAKCLMNNGSKPGHPDASGQGSGGGLNGNGWILTDIRKWLNEDFYNSLPDELRNNIKTVSKISDAGGGTYGILVETYDKIFLPSLEELNISKQPSEEVFITSLGQGTPYILHTDDFSIKFDVPYWTRSANVRVAHRFVYIMPLNDPMTYDDTGAGGEFQLVIYFCI